MIDEGDIGRLSALVERAAAKAAADEQAEAAGEESAATKQATCEKVSRRKLWNDLAQAEARYHEAKARHDALHHAGHGLTFEQAQRRVESGQALLRRAEATLAREQTVADSLPSNMGHEALEEARIARDHAAAALDGFKLMADALSPEGDALRAEAAKALDDAADVLREAFADALPPVPKKRNSKRARTIAPRDSYPSDFDRFERWLRHRVDEFEAFEKAERAANKSPVAKDDKDKLFVGIDPEFLAKKAKVPADTIRVWSMAVSNRKLKKDTLYPSDGEKRLCMNYCANHLGYAEPGLAAMNRLVQYLFVVMDQRGISNEELARKACLSRRTIEAWAGSEPLRAPSLQDVLACFQALDLPLAPVSYEADRAFQNDAADAAMKLRPDAGWEFRPGESPDNPPQARSS
jgi:hypothetical protein